MRGARLVALVVALVFGVTSAAAEAQVWKPPSSKRTPGARPKAKQATPKKTRKIKKRPTRARAEKATAKPSKQKRKAPAPKKTKTKTKTKKKKLRDDDDFTIVEEDYPDED